jgi:hypothetical protein
MPSFTSFSSLYVLSLLFSFLSLNLYEFLKKINPDIPQAFSETNMQKDENFLEILAHWFIILTMNSMNYFRFYDESRS